MTVFLAVANRKGGVGKSTVSVMLAHAFAVWGKRRVLVLDLDSQCNASLILIGGEAWSAARKANQTIADYLYDMFDGEPVQPKEYVIAGAGDVCDERGAPARIWLVPGSLLLEDIQGELFLRKSRESRDPEVVGNHVRATLDRLMRRFAESYDVVIFDCAPGLSFAALSALAIANKVVVPFRPDYVSQFAVDRISMLIENKRFFGDVEEIPMEKRRYICLPNFVRDRGPERVLMEDIASMHPMMKCSLPQNDAVANAFDWTPKRKRIEEKYGAATAEVRRLYDELVGYLPL
jgi:cellulose biosynthesis protein BcsQ